jgi:hypothetical protein
MEGKRLGERSTVSMIPLAHEKIFHPIGPGPLLALLTAVMFAAFTVVIVEAIGETATLRIEVKIGNNLKELACLENVSPSPSAGRVWQYECRRK